MYPFALLLGFLLPFDAIQPLAAISWLALTSEKLVLLLVVAAWLLTGARSLPDGAERRALLPTVAFLAVSAVSALLAPDYADEALKSLWRLVAAGFVMLVALRLARDQATLRGLIWAVVLGAGVSALLGLGEAIGWSPFEALLGPFKVAPTRVAGELRVSGSFQYATIAAMYFEMVTPLAIVSAALAPGRAGRLLGTGVAALCTANVMLSLTRAGMLTLVLELGVLLVCAWRRPDWRRVVGPSLLCAAILVGGVAWLVVRNPVFDMRLVTEGDADWYGAAYVTPTALTLHSDQPVEVSVEVRNEGRLTWSPMGAHPFALGYRWLTDDGTGVLDLPTADVPLPRQIAPGETIQLQARIAVPSLPAGTYRLDWGMQQRDVVQFYERGWANAQTIVQIVPGPAAVGLPSVLPRDDGEAPWVVGRLDLWRAALHLVQTRPLIGVGPDNFRHLYGAVLGLEEWDERVQANNVYLEVLVDVGLAGLAAFGWIVAEALIGATRALRRSATYLTLGLSLGVLAFLAHGLLDSFLAFTPTAWLWWLMLGALAQKPHVSGR